MSRKEVLRPTVTGAYHILQNQVCDVHYRLPGSASSQNIKDERPPSLNKFHQDIGIDPQQMSSPEGA